MDTIGLAWLAGWQTRAPRPNAKLSCMRVEGWQAGGVAGRPAKRQAAERVRERERERERKRERERERERERRESSRQGNAALVGLTFPSLGSSPGSKGGGCGPTSQRGERERERKEGGGRGRRDPPLPVGVEGGGEIHHTPSGGMEEAPTSFYLQPLAFADGTLVDTVWARHLATSFLASSNFPAGRLACNGGSHTPCA
jgi:hypothetical protein